MEDQKEISEAIYCLKIGLMHAKVDLELKNKEEGFLDEVTITVKEARNIKTVLTRCFAMVAFDEEYKPKGSVII